MKAQGTSLAIYRPRPWPSRKTSSFLCWWWRSAQASRQPSIRLRSSSMAKSYSPVRSASFPHLSWFYWLLGSFLQPSLWSCSTLAS